MLKFLKKLLWPSVQSITSDLSDMVDALKTHAARCDAKAEKLANRVARAEEAFNRLVDAADRATDDLELEAAKAEAVAKRISSMLDV